MVRAVRGERARYRPMPSRLAAGSDPVTLARALLQASGSDTLYVADLDALQGCPPQLAVLRRLLAALPGRTLWLDAGFSGQENACHVLAQLGEEAQRVDPVFGSESLAGRAAALRAFAAHERAILSLDRLQQRPLDAAGCWDEPALWPRRVIVMTLERVGSAAGPDLAAVATQRRRAAPGTFVAGAGGIRSAADLQAAAQAGADAWLVASALHDGGLPVRAEGA